MDYIGGVKLNQLETDIKRLIEKYIEHDDKEAAKAAHTLFTHFNDEVRFTWTEMVMGDNA